MNVSLTPAASGFFPFNCSRHLIPSTSDFLNSSINTVVVKARTTLHATLERTMADGKTFCHKMARKRRLLGGGGQKKPTTFRLMWFKKRRAAFFKVNTTQHLVRLLKWQVQGEQKRCLTPPSQHQIASNAKKRLNTSSLREKKTPWKLSLN